MIINIEWLRDFLPLENEPFRIKELLADIGIQVIRADGDLIEIEDRLQRPDLLGHLGIARELAALLALEMKPTVWPAVPEDDEIRDAVDVQILDEEICQRYSAVSLDEIRDDAELAHIRERIGSMGIEPAGPIADVARYIMLATGQPIHAFDRSALAGDRLFIRRARPGETLRLPGGREIELQVDMPVIADVKKPVALAGIITGEEAAASPGTRHVILGSGAFVPEFVLSTEKRIGVTTEASRRAVRGCDIQLPPLVVNWAAALLSESDRPAPLDLVPRAFKPRTVVLRQSRIAELLGETIEEAFIIRVLTVLGFHLDPQHAGVWQVKIPSYRLDVEREADLVEEITRFYGVNRLPFALPSRPLSGEDAGESRHLCSNFRTYLFHQGYDEVVNPVFSDPEKEVWFGNENLAVEIRNPLDLQNALLKTTLLPGLLDNLVFNMESGAAGAHLFESGRVFQQRDEGCVERPRLALVTSGLVEPPHWRKADTESDLFHLKGTIEGGLAGLGFDSVVFREEDHPCLETGGALALFIKGERAGFLGEIQSEIREAFGIDPKVWGAEIDLDVLRSKYSRVYRGLPPGSSPVTSRTMRFAHAPDLSFQTVLDVIDRLALSNLENVVLLDRIAPDAAAGASGRYTLQFRFRLSRKEMTEEKADMLIEKIIKALQGEAGLHLVQGGEN